MNSIAVIFRGSRRFAVPGAFSLVWFLTVAGFAQQKPHDRNAQPVDGTWELNAPPLSNSYPLTDESKPQPGVPRGTTWSFELHNSKEFPGTARAIGVYVPAEYTSKKPACVYVALDGIDNQIPAVFDNLIYKHEMPVTIAVGVAAGSVAAAGSEQDSRMERSLEFDSLNGRLASLILNEVLPAVEQQTTPDGRRILLSRNPNDRAIAGVSTGGIGAFNVAWERPDAFRRVFTSVGTFVGMRGGEQLYVLVRKTEPKPLRVFMNDGFYDEWNGGPEMGDWFMSNLTMERALEFAGYDVAHIWGQGTHDAHQSAQITPAVMRWLWRDWPKPIVAQAPGNPRLKEVLIDGEDWHVEAKGCAQPIFLASDEGGKVFVSAGQKLVPLKANASCPAAGDLPIAFGPHGSAYMGAEGKILKFATGGRVETLADGIHAEGLTVSSKGNLYVAAGPELWLIRPNGEKVELSESLKDASAVTLTPDERWLFVGQRASHLSLSFRVLPDGTVDDGELFYDVYVPAWADGSGLAAVVMDREGRAYAATRMGVQIFDHNGRVIGILPLPGNQPAESLVFGGPNFSLLYVYSGGEVYVRKLKVGANPPASALREIPNWGAGL